MQLYFSNYEWLQLPAAPGMVPPVCTPAKVLACCWDAPVLLTRLSAMDLQETAGSSHRRPCRLPLCQARLSAATAVAGGSVSAPALSSGIPHVASQSYELLSNTDADGGGKKGLCMCCTGRPVAFRSTTVVVAIAERVTTLLVVHRARRLYLCSHRTSGIR